MMRTFLFKITAAVLIAVMAHAVLGLFADGRTDEFYLRFTGRRHASLILGTSRAAQGLRPTIMRDELQGTCASDLYNFAFTVGHSPYGPTYTRAVLAKLDPNASNGLFIVTVDPWALCLRKHEIASGTWDEESLALGEQCTFNGTPNYEYLVRYATTGWGAFLWDPRNDTLSKTILHEDGWLEVCVDLDSGSVATRTAAKARSYAEDMLPNCLPGNERMRALGELLTMLEPKGDIILVRLPVGEAIRSMEQRLWPDLDERLHQLAREHHSPYWDLDDPSRSYSFTDGNHMDSISSRSFSLELARRIAQHLSKTGQGS